MMLNGLLCFANIPVFFLSFILIIMSFFKPKDGNRRIQARRIESGCMGMWLFLFIGMFTICNWSSTLINFFSPGNSDVLKFSWFAMIVSSTIIMVLFGRGEAYQTATYRILFVLSIVFIEGIAGSVSASLADLIIQFKTGLRQVAPNSSINQLLADSSRVYITGYMVSLAIGAFFVCINILITQTFDANGVIPISWLVAVLAGGATGGSLYGGIWGAVAGGIIGIIAGLISLRKFMSKDYQDFLKFEELSDRISKWN